MKLIKPGLFELNPRMRIHSERIGEGEHHLVIIDDLFLHPSKVSKFMDDLPYTDDKELRRAAPTYRCVMNFPTRENIYRRVFELHYKAYPHIKELKEERLSFDQYFDGSSIIDVKSYPPHIDDYKRGRYALVIYMNERNIHGGTQFLRHATLGKESADDRDHDVFQNPTSIRLATPWDYLESEWHQYHLVPMKFNRLISYRNNLLHSMYTNGSFYRNHPRKTIVSNF